MPAARPILPLVAIVSLLLALVGAATFLTVSTAHAGIEGDCGATIAGQDVSGLDANSTDDAIDVDYNDRIVTTMTSPAGFESHKIKLQFLGGFERTVEDRDDNGETSFTEQVDVSDYAWLGVGLYKVKGEANVVGGFGCTGAALVNVTGRNPVTTVVGGVATAGVVVGTAGAAATGIAGVRRRPPFDEVREMVEESVREETGIGQAEPPVTPEEMGEGAPVAADYISALEMFGCLCLAALSILMLPLMALTGGGAGAGAPGGTPPAAQRARRRVPRRRWLPRITLVGIGSGLLAGLAGVILVQQFAIAYPTMGMLIAFLAAGAVVYGLVVPTIGATIGWMLTNAQIGRMERGGGA